MHGEKHLYEDFLAADFGNGISARRDESGKVLLNIPGHGTMLAREAIRHGIVKVSRA